MGSRLDRGKLLSRAYIGYLEFVAKTSKIVYEGEEKDFKDSIIGFWHGDSYSMNLAIPKLAPRNSDIRVVVTADRRGDYIEDILKHYGSKALRMPDGIRMKGFLRDLKSESKRPEGIMAIALDGPLGPLHEPKKIAPLLSSESNKKLIGIKIDYSKKISLKKRWDNYSIPLPFTRINISSKNFGIVDKEGIKNFHKLSEEIKNSL